MKKTEFKCIENTSVNELNGNLTEEILNAAEKAGMYKVPGKIEENAEWFDKECREKKVKVRSLQQR